MTLESSISDITRLLHMQGQEIDRLQDIILRKEDENKRLKRALKSKQR